MIQEKKKSLNITMSPNFVVKKIRSIGRVIKFRERPFHQGDQRKVCEESI